REEGDVRTRVGESESIRELDAVQDDRLRACRQVHVLESEIAVAVAHVAVAHPCDEALRMCTQELELAHLDLERALETDELDRKIPRLREVLLDVVCDPLVPAEL